MIKKTIAILILLTLFLSSANAEVFEAKSKNNFYTKDMIKSICNVTDESITTKECTIPLNSDEFKKRLELVNWYNDFNSVIGLKMYNEVLWDLTYNEFSYEVDGVLYPGKENADEILNMYIGNDFYHSAIQYLKNKSYTEKDLKEININNLLVTLRTLKKRTIGYNELEINRNNLIKDGYLENSEYYDSVDLYNIDLIEKLTREHYFQYYIDKKKEIYNKYYYNNVRISLNLIKIWDAFYRDFTDYDEIVLKQIGFTDSEIKRIKTGEYVNTFENKTNFEYKIDQKVGTDIIVKENGYSSYDEYITDTTNQFLNNGEKTKIQMYAETWGKNINIDYPSVQKVLVNYFKKYKVKKGVTLKMYNNRVSDLRDNLPKIIEMYEDKYNKATNSNDKELFKKYVWILLLAEKVMNETNF